MKILIATQYFYPKSEVAALRMLALSEGLSELGWTVDVLTVNANPFNPLESRLDLDVEPGPLVSVITFDSPRVARILYAVRGYLAKARRTSFHGVTRESTARKGTRGKRLQLLKLASLSNRRARKAIDAGYVGRFAKARGIGHEYDVVFSSFGPRYMVDAGIALSHRFPSAALVVDIRDPIVRKKGAETPQETSCQLRMEERMASVADGISVVSVEMLSFPEDRYRGVVSVIPNGFHALPPAAAPIRTSRSEVLKLYYGGRLYENQRLESLVLACLALHQDIPVIVEYAGPDGADFLSRFEKHGAGGLVHLNGFLPRDAALALATSCHVAIVLSWHTSEKGVMTGKVYELIALNLPVVAIVVGDHAGSSLAQAFVGDPLRRVFSNEPDDGDTVESIADFLVFASSAPQVLRARFSGPETYADMSYARIVHSLNTFLETVVRHKGLA